MPEFHDRTTARSVTTQPPRPSVDATFNGIRLLSPYAHSKYTERTLEIHWEPVGCFAVEQTTKNASISIEIEGLSRIFSDGTGLHPTDLKIRAGEFVSILGPSGCGKSTLLRCLAGLESPDQGTVRFGDRVVTGPTVKDTPANRRRIGMVFQDLALWPHLSVLGNAAFPLQVSARRGGNSQRGEVKAQAEEALALVGMEKFTDKMPHQLSGGQQQRVAIARAVVAAPDVLLMDEPFSALDATLRAQLRMELVELTRRLGLTTLYVTHDQEEAMAMSQRIVVMHAGQILQFDAPETLYRHPSHEFVAEFVGTFNKLPPAFRRNGRTEGVRPENVTAVDSAALSDPAAPSDPDAILLEATPLACTYTGGRYLVRCQVEGVEEHWAVESSTRVELDSLLRLSVSPEHVLTLGSAPEPIRAPGMRQPA